MTELGQESYDSRYLLDKGTFYLHDFSHFQQIFFFNFSLFPSVKYLKEKKDCNSVNVLALLKGIGHKM